MSLHRLILVLSFCFVGISAEAQPVGAASGKPTASSQSAAQAVAQSVSAALQTTARRQYPGGLDEEDLTVQATLPNPVRGNEPNEASMSGEAGSAAESPASD